MSPQSPWLVAPLVLVGLLVTAFLVTLSHRRLALPAGRPKGIDAALGFAILLWVSGIASMGLLLWSAGSLDAEPSLMVAIAGTAAGGLAAAAFSAVRLGPESRGLSQWGGRSFAVALLLVPAFLGLSAGWVSLLDALGLPMQPQQLLSMVEAEGRTPALFAALAYGAVGAPFTEELLFRGLLLRALRGRLSVAAAVGAQGLLFGLVHGADPAAVPPLVVLGLLLGWLRERSGSLWPCIALHAGNNVVALSLAVFGLDL